MVRTSHLAAAAALCFTHASGFVIPAIQGGYAALGREDLDGDGVPESHCQLGRRRATCLLEDGHWTTISALRDEATSTTAASASTVTAATMLKQLHNGVYVASTLSTATTTTTPIAIPSAINFPASDVWLAGNGTIWTVEYVGNLNFTQTMQADSLGGDKCRTSSIGGKVFWSCGDMECSNNPYQCGFSMGATFYAGDDVGTIPTDDITNVGDYTFAEAWSGDPQPRDGYDQYGMDTSNVAAINSTHGVAYVWEIWRGAENNTIVDIGPGAVSVTLGELKPVATRVGPLLAGPEALQLGLIAIMNQGDYVYVYSYGGPTNVNVARVAASDDVFDATKYEFLVYETQTWETPGAIPAQNQTTYGLKTYEKGGAFGCLVYGSAFYNPEWGLYVIMCNAYMSVTMMYVSKSPSGPFSETLTLLDYPGYGSHAHPEYGLNPLYFSQGPDGPFNMFKLSFNF